MGSGLTDWTAAMTTQSLAINGNRPKNNEAAVSASRPASIPGGASCGAFGVSFNGPLKGFMAITSAIAVTIMADTIAITSKNTSKWLADSTASNIGSLPTKPNNGGRPASERAANAATTAVT